MFVEKSGSSASLLQRRSTLTGKLGDVQRRGRRSNTFASAITMAHVVTPANAIALAPVASLARREGYSN
jgi:hypothetical protein